MALETAPDYVVTITVVDLDKNTSPISLRYAGANLESAVRTEVTTVVIPALDAIIDGVVQSYSISRKFEETDLTILNAAPESSEVSRKGVFTFRTSYGTTSKVEVPSILNTLVINGSNIIDMSDPLVTAFLAALAPTVPGATSPVDPAGGTLVFTGRAGEKIHRKSSKG